MACCKYMLKLTPDTRRLMYRLLNATVLVLSVALIAYLSVLTFRGHEFFSDRGYMTFQLWVCIVFLADFFIELFMAADRWHYLWRRWFFMVMSIPYLNIVAGMGIPLTTDTLYFLRFVPLARAALALSIVVGYISANRLTNIFASYTVILVAIVYFGSLIFFERENGVNPQVTNYLTALWWAAADATTTGCDIQPITAAGKIVAAVMATMGMVMFPLFTVVITSAVAKRVKGG